MASKMAKQLHGSIIKNTDKFIGKVTPEGFFDIFHFCETVGISFMLTFNQNPHIVSQGFLQVLREIAT